MDVYVYSASLKASTSTLRHLLQLAKSGNPAVFRGEPQNTAVCFDLGIVKFEVGRRERLDAKVLDDLRTS